MIQIKWKMWIAIIWLLAMRSIWTIVLVMKQLLSCHVPNFVMVTCLCIKAKWNFHQFWLVVKEIMSRMGTRLWLHHGGRILSTQSMDSHCHHILKQDWMIPCLLYLLPMMTDVDWWQCHLIHFGFHFIIWILYLCSCECDFMSPVISHSWDVAYFLSLTYNWHMPT